MAGFWYRIDVRKYLLSDKSFLTPINPGWGHCQLQRLHLPTDALEAKTPLPKQTQLWVFILVKAITCLCPSDVGFYRAGTQDQGEMASRNQICLKSISVGSEGWLNQRKGLLWKRL